MKRKRLKNLEVFEVSFAANPANKKKFFLIKEGERLNKILELLNTKFENEKNIEEIITKMEISEEAKEAIKGALKLLYAYKDEIPPEIIAELTKLLGLEYAEPQYPPPAEQQKEKEEEEEEEEKKESESPVIKEQIEKIMKENQELKERLQKEIRERKIKDALLMIEKDLSHLPEKGENLAKILVELEERIPEYYPNLLKFLKGYSEAVKELTKEIGTSNEPHTNTWAKIEALAKELMQKEKITKEQAIAKVLEQNPYLYEEYRKER